jgi:hypothetical protein
VAFGLAAFAFGLAAFAFGLAAFAFGRATFVLAFCRPAFCLPALSRAFFFAIWSSLWLPNGRC